MRGRRRGRHKPSLDRSLFATPESTRCPLPIRATDGTTTRLGKKNEMNRRPRRKLLAKYVKFNQNQATSRVQLPLDSRESTALLVTGDSTPSQPLPSRGLHPVAGAQRELDYRPGFRQRRPLTGRRATNSASERAIERKHKGLEDISMPPRRRSRDPWKPTPLGRHLIEKWALNEDGTGVREESS